MYTCIHIHIYTYIDMYIYVYTYATMKVHIYVYIHERVKSQKIKATQLHNRVMTVETFISPYTCTHPNEWMKSLTKHTKNRSAAQ